MHISATIGLLATAAPGGASDHALSTRARQILSHVGVRGTLGGRATVEGDTASLLVTARRLRTQILADPRHALAAIICLGGPVPGSRPALAGALRGPAAATAGGGAAPPGRLRRESA